MFMQSLARTALKARSIGIIQPLGWVCRECAAASAQAARDNTRVREAALSARCFSTSAKLSKKNKKHPRQTELSDTSPDEARSAATDDIYDFSTLEAGILKAIERLAHKLSELRPGGRLNPNMLESLKVTFGKGRGDARLSDVAQVIPRGRNITVVVGEEDHIKPVSRAILASPYSLNPQGPTADAPTTLTIPVPMATGESRHKTLEDAKNLANTANGTIRAELQKHQKHMRNLQLAKKVRPDDLQKARKKMEDVGRRGADEVKSIYDGAKKVLET